VRVAWVRGRILQTFLINLDRAPERLARMETLFGSLDLTFVRVPAVDGSLLGEEEIRRLQPTPGDFGWLSKGEIGCFLSHRKCWQSIAEGKSNFGVVFEDDIVISARAADLLKNFSWIPTDADVVKLDAAPFATYIGRRKRELPDGAGLYRLCFNHYCTSGYIISKAAAVQLLNKSEILTAPVDEFMFNVVSSAFHALRIYQMVPALCVQERYVLPASVTNGPETFIGNRTFKGRLKRRKKVLRELYSGLNRIGTWVGIRQRLIVKYDLPYCEGV